MTGVQTCALPISESRIAVIGVIIEDEASVEAFNALAHAYRHIILGRMGVPHRSRHINIVSLAVDGPQSEINALSGRIGRLRGVHVKTAYASTADDHGQSTTARTISTTAPDPKP